MNSEIIKILSIVVSILVLRWMNSLVNKTLSVAVPILVLRWFNCLVNKTLGVAVPILVLRWFNCLVNKALSVAVLYWFYVDSTVWQIRPSMSPSRYWFYVHWTVDVLLLVLQWLNNEVSKIQCYRVGIVFVLTEVWGKYSKIFLLCQFLLTLIQHWDE